MHLLEIDLALAGTVYFLSSGNRLEDTSPIEERCTLLVNRETKLCLKESKYMNLSSAL